MTQKVIWKGTHSGFHSQVIAFDKGLMFDCFVEMIELSEFVAKQPQREYFWMSL